VVPFLACLFIVMACACVLVVSSHGNDAYLVQQLLYSVQQTRDDAAMAGFYGDQPASWDEYYNYYGYNSGPSWYQNTSAVSPEQHPDPAAEGYHPSSDQVYYDENGNPYTYDENGVYHYQTPAKPQPP
jgi:hypothetical protein